MCMRVLACIIVCAHICKQASVPPHAGEDSVISEISSGSVCFGSAGCGTSSSADATTTETSDDESGPPRNAKFVTAVPVVWERLVKEIRVVVIGVEEAVVVVIVVAVDEMEVATMVSVVVVAVAGVVVAVAITMAATLRVILLVLVLP